MKMNLVMKEQSLNNFLTRISMLIQYLDKVLLDLSKILADLGKFRPAVLDKFALLQAGSGNFTFIHTLKGTLLKTFFFFWRSTSTIKRIFGMAISQNIWASLIRHSSKTSSFGKV